MHNREYRIFRKIMFREYHARANQSIAICRVSQDHLDFYVDCPLRGNKCMSSLLYTRKGSCVAIQESAWFRAANHATFYIHEWELGDLPHHAVTASIPRTLISRLATPSILEMTTCPAKTTSSTVFVAHNLLWKILAAILGQASGRAAFWTFYGERLFSF